MRNQYPGAPQGGRGVKERSEVGPEHLRRKAWVDARNAAIQATPLHAGDSGTFGGVKRSPS